MVSHHPRVKATLARALLTRSPAHAEGSGAKATLTLALLRLLIGWLATRAGPKPEVALRHACDACWLAIGFFGLLRRSELFAMTPADITDLPGGGVSVWIARSKADQLGRGVSVCLAECTESGVPIGRIVRRFREAHAWAGGKASDPLFPRWGRTGPAFGHSMAKGVFTSRLRELLGAAQSEFPQLGLRLELFSAHSLHRGGAIAMVWQRRG